MLKESVDEYFSTAFSVSSEVTDASSSILLSSPTVVEAGVKSSCVPSMSVEEDMTVVRSLIADLVVVVVNLVTVLVDEVFVFDSPEAGEDTEVINGEKLFISLSLLNCSLSSSKQYLISVSVKCFINIFFIPLFCFDLVSSIFKEGNNIQKECEKNILSIYL